MMFGIALLVVFGTGLSNSMGAEEAELSRARLVWSDFDGDGLQDVYVVRPRGRDALYRNVGDGSFEDVTARALDCVECASLEVAWHDVDQDGRPDLLRLQVSGSLELLRNRGDGVFEDVTLAAGLEHVSGADATHWLDYDADGRADLELATESGPIVFHSLGDFRFEAVTFDDLGGSSSPERAQVRAIPGALDGSVTAVSDVTNPPLGDDESPARRSERGTLALSGPLEADVHPDPLVVGTPAVDPLEPNPGVGLQLPPFGNRCALSVKDTSTGDCVLVSSLPTLGKLYPISANLFVSTGGDVGIGTTSPTAKLDVAGSARVSNTLTLSPGDDRALDVTTGSIYKSGVLFVHTKGGEGNTALGQEALTAVTTGSYNTANGYRALFKNTIGTHNTASGHGALFSNTTGRYNSASGWGALSGNTTGHRNTALGWGALAVSTTGNNNIAIGQYAGLNVSTGSNNIVIGSVGVALDSSRIRIGTAGTHARTYIAGIRGTTTSVADAVPVVVDSAGQLGTVSSSRRFKRDVADMGDATTRLLELRPVVFRYEQEQSVPVGEVPLEYGLIAEEVAEIFPDLVVYDEEGLPFTVKYHLLSAMLLNELKKLDAAHAGELDLLRSEFEARFASLESRAPAGVLSSARCTEDR